MGQEIEDLQVEGKRSKKYMVPSPALKEIEFKEKSDAKWNKGTSLRERPRQLSFQVVKGN